LLVPLVAWAHRNSVLYKMNNNVLINAM
jgi:hypothetical protein